MDTKSPMQDKLTGSWNNTAITVVLLSVITSVAIFDALAFRILGLIVPNYKVIVSAFVFGITFVIFEIMWITILREIYSLKLINTYILSRSFRSFYGIVIISPFVGSAIIVAIILEMIKSTSYHIFLIPIATFASYIPAIIILSILILKLIRWFKRKRDYVMLSYTVAITTILISAIFFIVNLPTELYNYRVERKSISFQQRITEVGIPTQYFPEAYQYSSFIAFISTWVATAILLHSYSRKVGKVIYWLLVALPLLYFLGQYPPVFNYIFSSVRDSDPSLYARLFTLIFGLTKIAGGTFFAIGFWAIARNINNKHVKEYLRFSGFGILLLFVATQTNSVILSPYPPFGIIAISSIALASLLTFVGLYLTALSISRETNLRIEIDKKVTQLSFVKKMGTAQMEEDLFRQVLPIVERTKEAEDNIPTSLETEDIKLYVKEALEALKKTKSY